jgi:hypothetical protein
VLEYNVRIKVLDWKSRLEIMFYCDLQSSTTKTLRTTDLSHNEAGDRVIHHVSGILKVIEESR